MNIQEISTQEISSQDNTQDITQDITQDTQDNTQRISDEGKKKLFELLINARINIGQELCQLLALFYPKDIVDAIDEMTIEEIDEFCKIKLPSEDIDLLETSEEFKRLRSLIISQGYIFAGTLLEFYEYVKKILPPAVNKE